MGLGTDSGESDNESPVQETYERIKASDWVDGPARLPESHVTAGHIASLSEADGQAFSNEFILAALEAGETCVRVGFEANPEIPGVDMDTLPGTLEDHSVEGLFGGDDADADALVRGIRSLTADEEVGSVVVDVAPLCSRVPPAELLAAETELNAVSRETGTVLLSRYDRERIADGTIADLLQAYPYVVDDGIMACNPTYVPPEEFTGTPETGGLDRQVSLLTDLAECELDRSEIRQREKRLKVFANSIAHDLRNPLQTAIGRAELLSDEDEQVQVVRDALDRMEELIHDGLKMVHTEDLSDSEWVSVPALARQCWEVIESEDAELVLTEEFVVEGDRSRLRQLLENLFRNSIEHGGSNVTIEVGPIEQIHLATRAEAAGYTGFYVEDDGKGIPKSRRDDVFELGHTGGDGTGYGLAIVNRIAEAHGWTIHVASGRHGGARFEITGAEVQ